MKKLYLLAAMASAALMASTAMAESTFTSPAVLGSTATARVDASIVVPQVLFLRVGTSSGNAATDGTINALSFTVPAANVGDSTVIAGVGGDIGVGAVTVRAYGNGGNV